VSLRKCLGSSGPTAWVVRSSPRAQNSKREVVDLLLNRSAHADAQQQKAASPQVLRSGGLQR
jgi:hypothetical protein